MHTYQLCIALIIGISAVFGSGIERVDDSDLIHILTGEADVIALFTKPKCDECVKYEEVLVKVQDELKETLGATVVQAVDSNLIHIYDPSLEPALLYFRRGIPILYHGEINGDEILQFFNDNREPAVKELSDDNFEHLTQASTGATTGDWFIFFNSAECVLCQRLYAVWESVGGTLKRKLNVARVNALGAGSSTAKRFKVVDTPAFILLRRGKVFRYKLNDYTPKAFVDFVDGGFMNVYAEQVLPPASLMDEISMKQIVDYVSRFGIMPFAIMGGFSVLLLIFALKSLFKSSEKKQPAKTKKNK